MVSRQGYAKVAAACLLAIHTFRGGEYAPHGVANHIILFLSKRNVMVAGDPSMYSEQDLLPDKQEVLGILEGAARK